MFGCCSRLDNFSLTCWDHRDKVSFRMRSRSLSALTRAFTWPSLLIIILLICVCLFAFAAVAHVHGGLQRSECASSRQSQLLNDDQWLQQRDLWRQTKRGHACQRNFHDTWICDTNTLSRCSVLFFVLLMMTMKSPKSAIDLKQSLRTARTRKLMF